MAQYSYQEISLTSNIVLQWPFAFTSLPLLLDINDVQPSADGFTITFPDATLAQPGEMVQVNNISAFSFTVLADDGITTIEFFPAGQIANVQLIDNSTPNGAWRIIPLQSSASGVTSFSVQSSDASIDVTTTPGGGTITPPGGAIDLVLPAPLSNLSTLVGPGYVVQLTDGPPTYETTSLVAGTNITIINPNGVLPTVINLANSVSGLSSLQVGDVTITGDVISNNVADGNIQLNSNGTGNVSINGVLIDTSGNISDVVGVTANFVDLVAAKVGDIVLSTNIITTDVTNGNIQLNSNGAGTVQLNGILISTTRNISNVNNLTGSMATLASAQLGDLTVIGPTITNGFTNGNIQLVTKNPGNGNIQLTTNGTGKVIINGVTIDTSANITGINNLIAPKSWVLFTDTVGLPNVIAIQAKSNVYNVTGGTGVYVITFGTPFATTDYGVEIAFGNSGEAPFSNYFGYTVSKAINQVTIIVVDSAGEYVSQFPDGISASIMSL